MSKREKLCLQLRNRSGQDNETECRHYIKCKSAYLRSVFFGLNQVCLFIICLILTTLCLLKINTIENGIFRIIIYIFIVVTGVSYLFLIFKGLWYWKYTRHVFVTNEGIWVMTCSTMWWEAAPDFTGKTRFLAPSWSLYSWDELQGVSDKDNSRSVSKTYDFFKAYNKFISKSSKIKTLYLKRWDGTEPIEFLKNSDAEEILAYAKSHKKSSERKNI